MTESKPKRRSFRFSLRTLLIVVTLAAVGSWAYWIGWPWWQIYRERASIEHAAKQLKRGMAADAIGGVLTASGHWGSQTKIERDGPNCRGETHFETGRDAYFTYFELQGEKGCDEKAPCKTIRVYRLRRAPAAASSVGDMHAAFFDFLTGDRKNNPGFPYELIYSDPPTNPMQ